MKTEKLFDAMDFIADDYKKEAVEAMKHKHETKRRTLGTPIRVLMLAAVIACLFVGTAFAVGNYINSPQQAEKIARAELQKMKDMGILGEEFFVSDAPADRVIELPPYDAETYFFGRIWPHRYSVQWYKNSSIENNWQGDNPYTIITQIDTAEGKIIALTVEAAAGADEEPVRVLEDQQVPVGYDEEKKQPIMDTVDYIYYDNYEDIIPEGLTVDRLCSRLNDYWGFEGYSIVDTVDEFYDFEGIATPSGDTCVRELPKDNYYLSVIFEGDQPGVPRYIQLCEFPGYVAMIVGTNHAVG